MLLSGRIATAPRSWFSCSAPSLDATPNASLEERGTAGHPISAIIVVEASPDLEAAGAEARLSGYIAPEKSIDLLRSGFDSLSGCESAAGAPAGKLA